MKAEAPMTRVVRVDPEPDWVELGCRGWHIDETGAELARDGGEEYGGDPSVCCEGDVAHLDLETTEVLICGCPFFLRRVVHDLTVAGVVPYPTPTITTTGSSSMTVWIPPKPFWTSNA